MNKYQHKIRCMGRKLSDLRKESGLSQAELAKRVSRTAAYISKVERGLNSMSLEMLFTISDNLQVDPSELLGNPRPKDVDSFKTIRNRMNQLLSVTTSKKAKLMLLLCKQVHEYE